MKWVIFVNNMVYPQLLLPGKRVKNIIKATKIIKNTKQIISKLKRKMFRKNMLTKNLEKVNVSIVENLVILVKTANRNLVN